MGEGHEGRWKSDSHSENWNAWSHWAKGYAQVQILQQVHTSSSDFVGALWQTGALTILQSCFARSAMPFGGFEKANQFLKFQLPETEAKEEPEPAVVYQHDIGCRPSFNRTPIGWVGSSEPSSIHMETDAVPFDGETDELWKKYSYCDYTHCAQTHTHTQAWMHAYTLACTHTHTIDELTINWNWIFQCG